MVGSCFKLPFTDDSFDLAVSVELLGHPAYFNEAQTAKGIDELKRVANEVRIYSHSLNGNMALIEKFLPHRKISKVGEHLMIVN